MTRVFARSLHALEAEQRQHSTSAWVVVMALLLAWIWWLVASPIAVVEHAVRARLETEGTARQLQSAVTGRVLRNQLVLGAEVRAGDVVIELDATTQRLALEEKRQRRASCATQLTYLEEELRLRERNLGTSLEAARAQQQQAQARRDEADVTARFASQEVQRLTGLVSVGSTSQLDLQRATTEAAARDAARAALLHDVQRLDWQARRDDSEARASVARLQREIEALRGEVGMLDTTIAKQENELEDFAIRSPVTGRVGEVVELGVGAVVEPGDKLGAVVPSGDVMVVAELSAASAVGRVKPGQQAEVRLASFPWVEFGSLRATVASVASEARDGRVRAQLAIDRTSNTRIPLQHGLSASVDVEVERTSPARLALRTTGRLLGGARDEGAKP